MLENNPSESIDETRREACLERRSDTWHMQHERNLNDLQDMLNIANGCDKTRPSVACAISNFKDISASNAR